MKILVTGSNGLLGQKITDQILSRKQNVQLIATSRGANRHPVKEGYRYLDLDLTQFETLEAVLKEVHPDIVIHTAALTNVDACESNPALCHLLNVDVVEKIWSWCKAHHAYFLHLSTDFIFDGKKGDLYTEEDRPNPLSVYGKSKWESEQILLKDEKKHWGIARTILVYGKVAEMSRNNIALWAIDSLKQEKPMKVVNDQFRTPTLAEDLADGCLRMADRRAKGVYNISGPDYLSVYDFVMEVAGVFKLSADKVTETTSEELGQPANRPAKTGFDLSKSRHELGYRPHSIRQGLQLLKNQLAADHE